MKPVVLLCYIWAFPNTVLGLILTFPAFMTGGRIRRIDGVLEISGRSAAWMLHRIPFVAPVSAMTLGHVVFAVDEAVHEQWREHERMHVRQYERWGPLFIPAYLACYIAARLRGEDGYYGNRFEAEAFGHERRIT